MINYFVTAVSGWVGAIGIGFGSLLPYLLRRTALSRYLGLELVNSQPYLGRMWPHYWIGYLIAGVSTIHAWLSMSTGHIRTSVTGLWMATVALGLVWLQLWIGLMLRQPRAASERKVLRLWHFWGMFAIAALVTLHVRINR
jgi:hypothetical protein